MERAAVSCDTINCSNLNISAHIITNNLNYTIMNRNEFNAIRLYCDLTFANVANVSVKTVVDDIDKDAAKIEWSREKYLDYLIVTGKRPEN